MTDLYHQWGGDLALSASGDLLTVSPGTTQRVLRRLLTNLGDYVWHGDYGGGLGRYVGQPARVQQIQAAILRQMQLERGVAQTPAPTVTVTTDNAGTTTVTITYADAVTGQTVIETMPLT